MKPTLSDNDLRDAVLKELDSDPELTAKHIWVTAMDGAVTLGGHVTTIHEKHVAVRAAERVAAVRAVADDIEVRESSQDGRADDEIAEEIGRRRGRNAHSPDSVGVQVRDGRVVLHGRVGSTSERESIELAARQIAGVRAVDNLIEVEQRPSPADIERRVQEAVARIVSPEARSIQVTSVDGVVHLHGHVSSIAALQAAIDAAETAPGVTKVESEIVMTVQGG
jgi:osmotically-inducible protein OsmY